MSTNNLHVVPAMKVLTHSSTSSSAQHKVTTVSHTRPRGSSSGLVVLHHAGSDIVKTGYLHIKRPPSKHMVKIRIKAWQKKFFVLRDESFRDGTTTLDIFSSNTDWIQDPLNAQEYSVDLRSVSHVDEYRESKSYPYAVVVSRSGSSPLVLGTDSELEMREWLLAIKLLSDKTKNQFLRGEKPKVAERRPSCPSFLQMSTSPTQTHTKTIVLSSNTDIPIVVKGNTSRSGSVQSLSPATAPRNVRSSESDEFQVSIEPSEGAQQNSLQGDYTLAVTWNEITLSAPGTGKETVRWPLLLIRKFKSETVGTGMDQITLEAAQKCGRFSGTYIFTTLCGPEIIEKVRHANRKLSSDLASRQHQSQMEWLKTAQLTLPGQKRIERAPSAPCLNQLVQPPRHTMPLPPVPVPSLATQHQRHNGHMSGSSTGSSGSGSLTGNVMEMSVGLPAQKGFMGQGYLDLLDDDSSLFDRNHSDSLDDIIFPESGFCESTVAETHHSSTHSEVHESSVIAQSSRPVNCVSPLTPPPLPPRTHTPQAKDQLDTARTPLGKSQAETPKSHYKTPPTSPDIIITHL